jgi:hypothetical protein
MHDYDLDGNFLYWYGLSLKKIGNKNKSLKFLLKSKKKCNDIFVNRELIKFYLINCKFSKAIKIFKDFFESTSQ